MSSVPITLLGATSAPAAGDRDRNATSQLLPIVTRTDAIVAGHAAVRFALRAGFSRRAACEVGIAVSELATNIVRHAGGRGGEVALALHCDALEVVASDRGNGDAAAIQRRLDAPEPDAHATGFDPQRRESGLGCGLPSVGRLMTEVSAEARAGGGLCITARRARWGSAP